MHFQVKNLDILNGNVCNWKHTTVSVQYCEDARERPLHLHINHYGTLQTNQIVIHQATNN
jgi:hypothetical protein